MIRFPHTLRCAPSGAFAVSCFMRVRAGAKCDFDARGGGAYGTGDRRMKQ